MKMDLLLELMVYKEMDMLEKNENKVMYTNLDRRNVIEIDFHINL
jgi:hypothetical protein